jgi:hypothetical protein
MELKQYRKLARQAAEQRLTNNEIGAIVGTGLTMTLAPTIGPALAGGAGLFSASTAAGGGGTGLFGGLLSSGAAGRMMSGTSATGVTPLPGSSRSIFGL